MASDLEVYLSSSPDPLTVSPFSLKGIKALPRRNSSTRPSLAKYADHGQRDRISTSPSKTIAFRTPAEPGSSPWKIKVTVQADSGTEGNKKNRSIVHRYSRGERTQRVPLKDEEKSSPVKRRGRPRKSEGSPMGRKRSLTPARRRSSGGKRIIAGQDNGEDNERSQAANAKTKGYRRSRRLELDGREQNQSLLQNTRASLSTDELTKDNALISDTRAKQAFNFESLTPLHEKYTELPQKKASSPKTPDKTMKSIRGRRCTPVKPIGWSENQPSSISSDSSGEITDHDDGFALLGSKKKSLQSSIEDCVGSNTYDRQLFVKSVQSETLNLQNFVSPPVRHHTGDEPRGQELETMIADCDNQSILNCEDFSIVSIDSLPSRQETSSCSWVGDTSSYDAPATPGIDSIIANFHIEESIGDELVSENSAPNDATDVKDDSVPASSNGIIQHIHGEEASRRHSFLHESSAAHGALEAYSSVTSEVPAASSNMPAEVQAVAGVSDHPCSSPGNGFMAQLGGFLMGNRKDEKTKNLSENLEHSASEETHNSCIITEHEVFSTSSLTKSDDENTRTPKKPRQGHGNSLQLPTPEDRIDNPGTANQSQSLSSEVDYTDIDKSIHLTQIMSPVSLAENNDSFASVTSNTMTTNTGDMNSLSPSDQLHEHLHQGQSSNSPDVSECKNNDNRSFNIEIDNRKDESVCSIKSTADQELRGHQYMSELLSESDSDTESLQNRNSGPIRTEQANYDVSGIVEHYQEELLKSTSAKSSSAVKFREEVVVINDSNVLEEDEHFSQGTSNFSASGYSQEDFEVTESNDIEDSILQEQLRPVPLHHKPSPLHLSRRNMSYVLGLQKSPATSSEHESQTQIHRRSIKSSPPILRPCRNLEDRQDRSFQTLQDTDNFIIDQNTIAEDESMQSDMKQLMKEMNEDIMQDEESCLHNEIDSSPFSYISGSLSSEHIQTNSTISSSTTHLRAVENELALNDEDASIDTSAASSGVLSRIWNSLSFSNQTADPNLAKYRPLPKVEPWTKTHYKVMDRMYQSLKKSPDEFSQGNPTNPPLPRSFKSEIGTKMANWGYSVTFTPEHMVLAARFHRLLTLDKAEDDELELGECCPGPAGRKIDEQTVCLRLFSVIVGEDIRRDERAGVPIDRSGRNVFVARH